MPIFDYHCSACGETREVLTQLSDPPKVVCAQCRGETVRLIGAPAFHLKGTGWHRPGASK